MPVIWPAPQDLLAWLGESNLSRNENNPAEVLAILASPVVGAYEKWYEVHREASLKIDALEEENKNLTIDKATVASLKNKIQQLEKADRAAHEDPAESDRLESQLQESRQEAESWKIHHLKASEEVTEWKRRFDELFELSKQTTRLAHLNDSLRMETPRQSQNLVVQKIKPLEPKRFEGAQDLEVVTQFLDDIEHYVRQGGAVCPRASTDNQRIDTLWRFLNTKIFKWFEDSLKKRGVSSIPPNDHDYGITWESVKTFFKRQFVPESAISVIRKEWHALKFNRSQVLRFNHRALELITILGGSLTITRDNPLWEEYLQKLPEATINDICQQARLMNVLKETKLTLSGMMDIVAERTLPFLPPSSFGNKPTGDDSGPGPAQTAAVGQFDPMDLSNVEEQLNAIGQTPRCYQCGGVGHLARQCPSPSARGPTHRSTQYTSRQSPAFGSDHSGKRFDPPQASRQDPHGQQSIRRHDSSESSKRESNNQQITRRHDTSANWRRQRGSDAGRTVNQTVRSRVYTVDDSDSKSGAYLAGGWADDNGGMEDGVRHRLEDLGEASDEEASEGGSGLGAGKANQ